MADLEEIIAEAAQKPKAVTVDGTRGERRHGLRHDTPYGHRLSRGRAADQILNTASFASGALNSILGFNIAFSS